MEILLFLASVLALSLRRLFEQALTASLINIYAPLNKALSFLSKYQSVMAYLKERVKNKVKKKLHSKSSTKMFMSMLQE